jgi:hypothetical protein
MLNKWYDSYAPKHFLREIKNNGWSCVELPPLNVTQLQEPLWAIEIDRQSRYGIALFQTDRRYPRVRKSTWTPFVAFETCRKVKCIEDTEEISDFGVAPAHYLDEVRDPVCWAITFRICLIVAHDLWCAVRPKRSQQIFQQGVSFVILCSIYSPAK